MAVKLTDVDVVYNSVDFSPYLRSITLPVSVDTNERNVMGSDWEQSGPGGQSWTITMELEQNFGAAAVDATLWASLGSTVTIVVKPTSGSVDTTNPSWTGSVFITDYTDKHLGGSQVR